MRKKLLLADDSITIQKVVELTFPSDEFEVVTAGNGRLAVDKAMTFLPDLVLCDVIMPQLDGYQVCEALRASPALKDVPVLFLNGAFEPYDAERARAVGALGNVSKPFDPPALVARVKEILSERSTAAFGRADLPDLEDIGATAKPEDDSPTMDVADVDVPDPTPAHAYSYDDSETHPVSADEVPMGVRELAARSLSLDAPVFASFEPEVLTTEAEPSFSKTLHGRLDADAPALAGEVVEEIEAMEEMEPVSPTGEFEAPRGGEVPPPPEMEAGQVEFETEEVHKELASTLPPASAPAVSAPTPVPEEFAGEHEFEPDELEGPAEAPTPEPKRAAPAPEHRAPAVAIGLPPPTDRPAPSADPVAPEALKRAAALAGPASFAGLVNPAETAPAASTPLSASPLAAATTLPSADVAVPVDMVQQIAQRVISQVSERVIREIAWDVIPGLAEQLIKAEIERIKARAESERD